jgi:hypothetical protein
VNNHSSCSPVCQSTPSSVIEVQMLNCSTSDCSSWSPFLQSTMLLRISCCYLSVRSHDSREDVTEEGKISGRRIQKQPKNERPEVSQVRGKQDSETFHCFRIRDTLIQNVQWYRSQNIICAFLPVQDKCVHCVRRWWSVRLLLEHK